MIMIMKRMLSYVTAFAVLITLSACSAAPTIEQITEMEASYSELADSHSQVNKKVMESGGSELLKASGECAADIAALGTKIADILPDITAEQLLQLTEEIEQLKKRVLTIESELK